MQNPLLPVDKNETAIERLLFSNRVHNVLINSGISSIEQLKKIPLRRLLRLQGMGREGIKEIQKGLDLFDSRS